MGLNDTPQSERIHIGFFGRRNAGKSSLVNAVTNQALAVVSNQKGTTTDPVYKSMELLPLGPVVIIDTAGFDDSGELGTLRIKKTKQVLNKTDIAIMVIDSEEGITTEDEEMINLIKRKEIPMLVVYNKSDFLSEPRTLGESEICVSATERIGIDELKETIGAMANTGAPEKFIVKDLIKPRDFIVMVVPIDESAPKGRIILPQQQTLREILDIDATAIVVQDTGLEDTFNRLGERPALVITDSQVFEKVAKVIPQEVPLTSFSILLARYKGYLETAAKGVQAISSLKDGDTVLIAEGCTHHRQCNDIGTVKIPNWLRKFTGKNINIESVSGTEFPEDLTPYAMVIHCGGCMLNEREVLYRMKCAIDQNIPFTNYGITIAYMNGILQRAVDGIAEVEER
ncbi:MAG: [FeFe] hydrogenase H-cluster maturation GTPase HydF [Clostridiales bacterium]|nr:[FeFe] hydrogenase H-cluster maturation GTPase HydF [Clostridiales bacterium]